MTRKDNYHDAVRNALERDGWTITDAPLAVQTPGTEFQIDLAAERVVISAEKSQSMDKVLKYQKAIVSFRGDYAKIKPANFKEVQNQLFLDTKNHHYQLVRVGWQDGKHVHYAVFHFDIIGDKVWVQQNRTDLPIGYELMDSGIAEGDLVYAYLPVELRGAAA